VVEDITTLPDLAPTFLEAGGIAPPEVMTAKSLWPVLKSNKEGLVDPERTQAYIGRERHVPEARAGNIPYPQRAIRTKDYLFVINFKPDRYPLGDPYRLNDGKEPSVKELIADTRVTLPDEDKGPTKAWIVTNRKGEAKTFFEQAYGKRPKEELYRISSDPYQMNNLADNPEYKEIIATLREKLLNELKTTGDPRMMDDGRFYEETIPAKTKTSGRKTNK
jgi:uncharacterized sulfatase